MRPGNIPALAALTVAITVTWFRFQSPIYPYSIMQPSSYRHLVIHDSANRKVDYFFPGLGSFTTNVNVYAYPGRTAPNPAAYLRSIGAKNVRRSGTLTIMGRRRALTRGDFQGLAGHWTEEQVSFATHGMIWRLTASYDRRYTRMRSTLVRILSSFHSQLGSRR